MYATLDKGPMFGGKSSALIRRYRTYFFQNNTKRIIVVKHSFDTRHSSKFIVSHEGAKIPCTPVSSLSDIDVLKYDVIFIDEAQWFTDLYQFIETNFHLDITVHIAGLNGDKHHKSFGQINSISSYMSEETLHTARCTFCNKPAPFTNCRINNLERNIAGGIELYYPVCHQHIKEISHK